MIKNSTLKNLDMNKNFIYAEVEDFLPKLFINSTYDNCILMLSKIIRTISEKEKITPNEIINDITAMNTINNLISVAINQKGKENE